LGASDHQRFRMNGLRALLFAAALLCATHPVAAADDPRAAAAYFIGTWSCDGTLWTFAPLLGDTTWIRVVYGSPAKPDGNAVIGYVSETKKYVFRDFHADGGYADISSDGPVDGRWLWSGPYYPAGGGVVDGRITYVVDGPERYERTFASVVNGQSKTMGRDVCTKET
jgi:hypothetical protein